MMPIWDKSESETFYADGRVSAKEECSVGIDETRIVIDATKSGGWMYQGDGSEVGHFELASSIPTGVATLHRSEGKEVLEGFWRQEGTYGMWRITLDSSEETQLYRREAGISPEH